MSPTDREKREKEKQDSKYRILENAQEGNTIELINMIVTGIQQYTELIIDNMKDPILNKEMVHKKLELLDVRLDYYMVMLHNLLLQDLFLPVNKLDFMRFVDMSDIVIDTLQSLRNRLSLLELTRDMRDHIVVMCQITFEMLNLTLSWLNETIPINPVNDLSMLQELEEKGDKYHRDFMRVLYEQEVPFKAFHLFTVLDALLEDLVDSTQKLGNTTYIVLHQYKIASKSLPKYLS